MTVETSKAGAYTVEGPNRPLMASKTAAYTVEGPSRPMLLSKMALYVVEGPPDTRRRRQSCVT